LLIRRPFLLDIGGDRTADGSRFAGIDEKPA
jgi:hypothetical protein